ncbi:hypothetical protein [Nonomuraea sp. LPB2021202275-12-8]|uniref:hypothetical protein n=1 Tax=Nonomuraea sp. LPB2021202275-12-8 TaxID=3120159 RepID=UPI00300D01B4
MAMCRTSMVGRALAVACVTLALAGCSTSQWQDVNNVTLSPDGRTLTVELLFSRPPIGP